MHFCGEFFLAVISEAIDAEASIREVFAVSVFRTH
jgi:hypothetical protein